MKSFHQLLLPSFTLCLLLFLPFQATLLLLDLIDIPAVHAVEDLPLGQRVLPHGMEQPRQRILNTIGGFYSQNVTLYFRNSPYRVQSDVVVESAATLTIETGVQLYFDTGVGMKVYGTLRAIGNEWAHIQMLPYQEQLNYDHSFPDFRLIDGPSVRQGRLQAKFRDRWRSVCTKVTNWTSVDTGVACRSMGYTDGGFWRFFRRNNDTYPLVMPAPRCTTSARSLWQCEGFTDKNAIPLSENLCQGEDDLGIYCWGPPIFTGWVKHWKGIQIYSSPFDYVAADPDSVSVQRESRSRLEFVDILYAGYDSAIRNTTAALYVEGVPPLMNGLLIGHSARDGIYFYEPAGPILIANSTIAKNRGHGIAVDNALDGRFYLNQSIVEGNYGDGIWYKQKHGGMTLAERFLSWEIGGGGVPKEAFIPVGFQPDYSLAAAGSRIYNDGSMEERRFKRQTTYYEKEKPRLDMCVEHRLPSHLYFPHLIMAHLQNGTLIDQSQQHYSHHHHPLSTAHASTSLPLCWLQVSLPARLRYTYTIQFLAVGNRNPPRLGTRSELVICEGNGTFPNHCQEERFRIPLWDGVLPQSAVLPNNGRPMYIGLDHSSTMVNHPHGGGPTAEHASSPVFVAGDVDLLFRIHATVTDKAFYGLNITNSVVLNNTGNGVQALNVRDRTALCNVSVNGNEGLAGLLVRDGAADIWINDTSLSHNWGDGVNISYAGGSVNLNSSRLVGNRWRGFALHYNSSIPFYALRHEVVIKGRPANNLFYPRMVVADNLWGGVLVGNMCVPASRGIEPKVLVNWVEFNNNHYHPALEVFACQRHDWRNGEERDFFDWNQPMALTKVDVSGNSFVRGSGMGFRMEPCVNARVDINSNRFHGLTNAAMLIRNAKHPQLSMLEARVVVAKNDIKANTGPQFVVSMGLNEDAPRQELLFNQQNELRGNTIVNPFPFLKPRSTPYAAMVVSSSNVIIRQNCFANPRADFELGVELMEHAKRIDARENNWGHSQPQSFLPRIFDQFNRYSLAAVEVNPYSAVCNQRQPANTYVQHYYRHFRLADQPLLIGGSIYENSDLGPGKYTVTDDLHVTPGAKLTISAGATLEFQNGVGMLVQGELLRSDYASANGGMASNPFLPVIFTAKTFTLPKLDNIRLVDPDTGDEDVLAGRLEVRLADGQWGTVCNRSWTAHHAQLACNQLGLVIDPEHFENWRIFPAAGDLPIRVDNIRCEEREFQLTDCRHDGPLHNVQSPLNCRPTEVVGLRCAQPYWAGVRYSLLASPPTITGQSTMQNWVIERAGLFDFRTSHFAPALQLDWNYHTFSGLTVRDNFYDGLCVVYNDLTKKPAIRHSYFGRNRRNGVVVRSVGLTMEKVTVEANENAGVRYNSRVASSLQRDIVSWLERSEQPELEANNVLIIPNASVNIVQVHESQLNHRLFLVAKEGPPSWCKQAASSNPFNSPSCLYELQLRASGRQYGMDSKLVVQLINRAYNESDEEAVFIDRRTGRRWSTRHNTIDFPIVSSGNTLLMQYRRSHGPPSLVMLVLYLDAQEYLDRFLHVYESVVRDNQYGVSAEHYSNLTLIHDSAYLNRWSQEKLWFQKVNFTGNSEAVLWVHSPQHAVVDGTPIAEITWHIDNCSIHHNHGPIVATHRDLYASANVFHWNLWSNTFANNSGSSGLTLQLPDTYDLLAPRAHSVWITENRFEQNTDFTLQLFGYYAFANISSNNFTDNVAPRGFGVVELGGMEKWLVMEKNRFFNNWGTWMVRVETMSQSLRSEDKEVPALIQYNYFQFNRFLRSVDEYVDMWPRSYAVGVFGTQRVDIHYNRLRNVLMDFEVVAGGKPQLPGGIAEVPRMNATYNWWGVANEAEVAQRLFDFDDWNIYSLADFSPYYTTEEQFINFWWWHPRLGQLSYANNHTEPGMHDLKGRMYESKRLVLDPERWYPFPYHYRPFRPYRITRDLTIMPGATLTIERNVEVHVWPNVRILVLGNLVADGTLWQPIRFKPINVTEYLESQGKVATRYRRSTSALPSNAGGEETQQLKKPRYPQLPWKRYRARQRRYNLDARYLHYIRKKTGQAHYPRTMPKKSSYSRVRRRAGHDDVFRQFPTLRRDNPFYQPFDSRLSENGTIPGRAGFLEFYNATTGEVVPSCDRFFTLRNAQVVCRELGFPTQNAYHWLTPRYDYNPQVRILKTYVEPRECRGNEARLDRCELRLSGEVLNWQCVDTTYFNYIHCGSNRSLSEEYFGNWGGITFASASLDTDGGGGMGDASILRHVEIVGAGHPHNDSLQSGALQIIRRSPILENVNVTNSSLHGIQIVAPGHNLILSRLNVSDNRGRGISIVSASLHASANPLSTGVGHNSAALAASIPPTAQNQGTSSISLPAYQLPGLLDMCASGKLVWVEGARLLLYYKYDSYSVDCVKTFRSRSGRNLGFRFLQANLFAGAAVASMYQGRSDHLSLYTGSSFSPSSLLYRFSANSTQPHYTQYQHGIVPTKSSVLSLHLRATAADGEYGFLAEVSTLPSPQTGKSMDEIALRNSRLLNNDRGAVEYRNVGEMGPNVIVEQCAIEDNGYHLFGNITTISLGSASAEFHLHNTMLFLFRANSLRHNFGGTLMIGARSSSSVARLNAVIKSCAFVANSNATALAFSGNSYQHLHLLHNVVAGNVALYHDTVLVEAMAANFSHNLFTQNIGLHTLDTKGMRTTNSYADATSFDYNVFEANLALGHGHQYAERFGLQPEQGTLDEFSGRRPKRQVLAQDGISFDWFTHVRPWESERFRSTILLGAGGGSAAATNQRLHHNLFNDPANDYELTTSAALGAQQYGIVDGIGNVDAKWNYWGFPSTLGVAAGKIRDQADYPYLAPVDYDPALESNTSLIEGDCLGGWFQVGNEEFKSCFLFTGASMTYVDAVEFCQEMGGFMPILRSNDELRQRQIAARVDAFAQRYITEVERYNAFGLAYDVPVWIASVSLPSNQCGWMSSRTASIGEQNCNNLLPVVCERGTQPYQEPLMWRRDVILAVVIFALLALLLACLALCACKKSQRRRESFIKRKAFIRESIRRSREDMQKQQKLHENSQQLHPHNYQPQLEDPVLHPSTTPITNMGAAPLMGTSSESNSGTSAAVRSDETYSRSNSSMATASVPTTSSVSSCSPGGPSRGGGKVAMTPQFSPRSPPAQRPKEIVPMSAMGSYHNPLFQSSPSLQQHYVNRKHPLGAPIQAANYGGITGIRSPADESSTSTTTTASTSQQNTSSATLTCSACDECDPSVSFISSNASSTSTTSTLCACPRHRQRNSTGHAPTHGRHFLPNRASTITEEESIASDSPSDNTTTCGKAGKRKKNTSPRSLSTSSDSTITPPSTAMGNKRAAAYPLLGRGRHKRREEVSHSASTLQMVDSTSSLILQPPPLRNGRTSGRTREQYVNLPGVDRVIATTAREWGGDGTDYRSATMELPRFGPNNLASMLHHVERGADGADFSSRRQYRPDISTAAATSLSRPRWPLAAATLSGPPPAYEVATTEATWLNGSSTKKTIIERQRDPANPLETAM